MDDAKLNAMNQVGQLLVDEIKAQIKLRNKVASGDLLNSIRYKLTNDNNKLEIDILGEPYLVFVDQGRRPGKRMIPTQKIEQWIGAKGLAIKGSKKSMAFAIAKSIQLKGINPTNIIQRALSNIKLQTNILLSEGFGKDLTKEVIEALQEIKQGK